MVSTASFVETIGGTVVIWVEVLNMSDIDLEVTVCFDMGYAATDVIIWVVSLGFTGKGVFAKTDEVGNDLSLVCANEGSLGPLHVVVFSVLKALIAVLNSVEYLGVFVGGMTVRVCNGLDTLECAKVADVFKSNAGDLVNVNVLTVKDSVSVLGVEISESFVVLTVDVLENIVGSGVPGGTLRVPEVFSVVPPKVNANIEEGVLILVNNLVKVVEMCLLVAPEKFVLM